MAGQARSLYRFMGYFGDDPVTEIPLPPQTLSSQSRRSRRAIAPSKEKLAPRRDPRSAVVRGRADRGNETSRSLAEGQAKAKPIPYEEAPSPRRKQKRPRLTIGKASHEASSQDRPEKNPVALGRSGALREDHSPLLATDWRRTRRRSLDCGTTDRCCASPATRTSQPSRNTKRNDQRLVRIWCGSQSVPGSPGLACTCCWSLSTNLLHEGFPSRMALRDSAARHELWPSGCAAEADLDTIVEIPRCSAGMVR
ncbi:MAG: hypothetical protein M1823_006035 [Watsoniomyces obsoletus]|nr:MAG: hypothetical protein M1823_006035 [Watsoniomyces obsoletus]